MTEKEMQLMLGKHFGIQYICIPNVLMTGEYKKDILPEIEKLESWQKPSRMYEADLIYITKSDYLVEIEIKVDINDFRSDFKKKIYRRLIERTKNYLVSGYENCEKLWAWG